MAKKTRVKVLSIKELEKLDTKRLLALKKTVDAKISALYLRNGLDSKSDSHPFNWGLKEMLEDKNEWLNLCDYRCLIKAILETREHVTKKK